MLFIKAYFSLLPLDLFQDLESRRSHFVSHRTAQQKHCGLLDTYFQYFVFRF